MAFSATFFISSELVSAPFAISLKLSLILLATVTAKVFASSCFSDFILISFMPSFINTPLFESSLIFIVCESDDSKSFAIFVNSTAKFCSCLAELLKFAISVANCVL